MNKLHYNIFSLVFLIVSSTIDIVMGAIYLTLCWLIFSIEYYDMIDVTYNEMNIGGLWKFITILTILTIGILTLWSFPYTIIIISVIFRSIFIAVRIYVLHLL